MATGTTDTGQGLAADQSVSTVRSAVLTMVRHLLCAGSTTIEASTLAGLAVGLGPVASGWSVLEIERLRFLQHLDASGELPA